jgi:hypothetical protein
MRYFDSPIYGFKFIYTDSSGKAWQMKGSAPPYGGPNLYELSNGRVFVPSPNFSGYNSYYYTDDQGSSYTAVTIAPPSGNGQAWIPFETPTPGRIVITASAELIPYQYPPDYYGMYYSTDWLQTATPVRVIDNLGNRRSSVFRAAVSPTNGHVYVVYGGNEYGGYWKASKSTDNGLTYPSSWESMSTRQWPINGTGYATLTAMVVTNSGTILMAGGIGTYGGPGGAHDFYIRRSTDDFVSHSEVYRGVTVSTIQHINHHLCVDRDSGRIWAGIMMLGESPNITYNILFSDNDGVTWNICEALVNSLYWYPFNMQSAPYDLRIIKGVLLGSCGDGGMWYVPPPYDKLWFLIENTPILSRAAILSLT